MPDVGEGIAEVEISDWKVAVGDDIKTNIFPNSKIKFHPTDLKTGERKVVEV